MTASTIVPPPWELYGPAQRWGFLLILFLVTLSNYTDRQVVSVPIEPIKAEFKVSDKLIGLLTGFALATREGLVREPRLFEAGGWLQWAPNRWSRP